MERVRQEVLSKKPADLKADVSLVPIMSGGMAQAMIMYDLSGPDLKQLEKYSEQHRQARCSKIPGAVDVSSNLVTGKPELSVQHRPREGRRPGRVGGRRGRRRCSCWWAA